VEPGNSALVERAQRIMEQRKRAEPTVPTTIGMEKQTNPFLRVDVSSEIQSKIGMSLDGKSAASAFAKLRSMKDSFRG
jgi:hydroxyacylglutathione hydrolase